MSEPRSIFTRAEDFLPASLQPPLKSPALSIANTDITTATSTTATDPRPLTSPQHFFSNHARNLGAWAQPPLPDSQPTSGRKAGTGFAVPNLALDQKRSKKRSLDTANIKDNSPLVKSEHPHKKSRLRNLYQHTLDRFDFPLPPQFDPTQPPSPLFFSHSVNSKRPQLPPRFSSGEAADRMLRQADAEESKVRTVKLARAAYSGSSPPAIGIPSYRSTSSTYGGQPSPSSPNTEERRDESVALLSHVGVAELLEQDPRPTLIVDLGDPLNYAPAGSLKVVFANSALRSNPALYEAVRGRGFDASPRTDPYRGFSQFKAWIVSATLNGESLEVCLPAFVHGGVSWSCSTLRKRLRVASASAAIASPPSGSSASATIPVRLTSEVLPMTSTGSYGRFHQEEPSDYFGDAPLHNPPSDSTTSARDVIPTIESTLSSSKSSGRGSTNGITHARAVTDIASLASHPSLQNECVLSASAAGTVDDFYRSLDTPDEVGFFDWTRLPYSENLPRHIKFARSIDWAGTSLGPIELWPADLRQMCNLIMASPHPAGGFIIFLCIGKWIEKG